ncbi:hypothetical protein L0666_14950 [Octadecabacter sp. CECT 8868]|uniref:hypothetical protein n=1 Tax=Octadecabacter algicola TaxID=2909342 RepID=UPI001F453E67|nr:hypothetical protein [Octadecabacter algicola]MCF2906291.1 hypothetical protein [Octadecabacter algicola]
MRIALVLAALVAQAGCSTADFAAMRSNVENLDLLDETRRDIDVAYRDLPFDTGTVYVVADEHGDLHTYSLTPCQNGTHICGGTGRAGHLQRTEDYFVVTGAYRDRTFYLSPGGDGYLTWRGVNRDLAWN